HPDHLVLRLTVGPASVAGGLRTHYAPPAGAGATKPSRSSPEATREAGRCGGSGAGSTRPAPVEQHGRDDQEDGHEPEEGDHGPAVLDRLVGDADPERHEAAEAHRAG